RGLGGGVGAKGGGEGGYSKRWSCSLKGRHVISCSGRIRAEHDRGSLDAGCNLIQQFEPLATHSGFDVDKSGKIPARAGQVRDETSPNRVRDADKYDRNRWCLVLECGSHGC